MLYSEGTIIKDGAKSRGAWDFLGAKIKASIQLFEDIIFPYLSKVKEERGYLFFYGFISSIKIISVFTIKYVLINKFSMTQDKQKHPITLIHTPSSMN